MNDKEKEICELCWLQYSSYCVDCKYKAIGLGLIKGD